MTDEKPKRTHRRHSDEFKTEAVSLANRIGIAKASRQLGVTESLLYTWRQKQSMPVEATEEAAEIKRLRRELAEKEEALAIVKKAAAYFAKELK